MEEETLTFISSITDRLLALALCGLAAVGGMPRLGCLCTNAAACDACRQATCTVCSSSHVMQHQCCCQKQDQEPPASDGMSCRVPGGCNCEKFTEQTVLTAVKRDVTGATNHAQPVATEPFRTLNRARSAPECVLLCHLPPDDPVSRCQILRL